MATPKQQIPPYPSNMPKSAQLSPSSRTLLLTQTLLEIKQRVNIWPAITRKRHTLRWQFIALAILLFLSSIGMTFLVSQQLQMAHDELNTIAIKSVPSVDAAQRLL